MHYRFPQFGNPDNKTVEKKTPDLETPPRLEANWNPLHDGGPVIITGYGAVDGIIDTLLQINATGWKDPYNAVVFTVPRTVVFAGKPSYWLSNIQDRPQSRSLNCLVVGVNAVDTVGSLRLIGDTTSWYAQGEKPGDGSKVWYRHHKGDHHFPPDSLISIPEIRKAVKVFMLQRGSRHPAGLFWEQWPRATPLTGRG